MNKMDIEKEREAFEAIPRNARVLRGAKFKDGEYVALSLFDESSKELAAQLNYGWEVWQAAKAQAKADTKRIDFLADKSQSVANVMLPTKIVERNLSSLRDAIDQAMMIEEKTND